MSILINYRINQSISKTQFLHVLTHSDLAQRRPTEDAECIQGMLDNSNLLVTAWDNQTLVGVARSVTDFHYACYLSDLAVVKSHQKLGIGKALLANTQEQLGCKCKLILLAAPAASDYYRHIGFANNPRCWVLDRDSRVSQ